MTIDIFDGSDIIYTALSDLGVQFDTNNTTPNGGSDINKRYVDRPVVPQVFSNTLNEDIDNTMTDIENAKYASSKITKDNFFDCTACNWKQVNNTMEKDPDYVSDSGSKYWYTESGVYRLSDHWGFGVGSCDWLLNEDPELSWRDDSGKRLGYANFSDFKSTKNKTFPEIFDVLTKQSVQLNDTDQRSEVVYYNYRSNMDEPSDNFTSDTIYNAPIETRFYATSAEDTQQTQSINVVDKVTENVVDGVTENVTQPVSGQNGAPRGYSGKKPGDIPLKNYAFELTTIEKLSAKDLGYINREFPEYSQSKLFNDLMEVDNELIALKNDPNVKSYLLANTKYQTNIIDYTAYEYLDKLTSLSKKVDDLIDNVKSHLPDEYLGAYDSTFSYGESVKDAIDEYYNKISDKIQDVIDNKNSSFELTTLEKIAEEQSMADTEKTSAFEIKVLADFVQDFNRQDELTDDQLNKFLNRLPVTEVGKDLKDKTKEDAKQTGKVITHIPKSLNYPYIEDELAGNQIFYGDMDWMEMSDLSEM